MSPAKGVLFHPSLLNNVKILTVDNNRDTGFLYAVLLGSYGAAVMTAESIKDALDLLNWFVPDILVCEARFLGESVYPLIQQVKSIAQNRSKAIPILMTSTLPAMNLAEQLKVRVEAYQMKPIELDQFVDTLRHLVLPSKIAYPPGIQNWAISQLDSPSFCSNGMN